MRVEAYYNLHKKCLSYRPSGGKVRHADALFLYNVRFAVQPAGREKVLREKRKNVHAFVRGEISDVNQSYETGEMFDLTPEDMQRHGFRPITYNPYKYDSFVYADTGERVDTARQVAIIGRNIWQVA